MYMYIIGNKGWVWIVVMSPSETVYIFMGHVGGGKFFTESRRGQRAEGDFPKLSIS